MYHTLSSLSGVVPSLVLLCSITAFADEWILGPAVAMTTSPPDRLQRLHLRDVQALHGGQTLWLMSDGTGYCQVITHQSGDRGFQEKRYHLQISQEELQRLSGLARNAADAGSPPPQRPGHFDEGKPSIHLDFASGPSVTVSKWLHDRDLAFDPLYAALLEVIHAAQMTTPIYQGPYDREWSP